MTRSVRGHRSIRWAAVLGVTTAIGLVPASHAAEADPPLSLLETPMADVAILEPHAPDPAEPVTPMLLVLDAISPTPDRARLAVLERTHEWTEVTAVEVDLGRDDLTARWLIGLGGWHFALVATTPPAATGRGTAVVVGFDVVDHVSDAVLVETGRGQTDRAIEAAGPADVDGLGTAELVVALRPFFDASGSCGTTSVRLLDSQTLDTRRSFALLGAIGPGVLGRWDDDPGDDLLAFVSPGCPPPSAGGTRLVSLRLRDGAETSVLDLPPERPASAYATPLRFNVSGVSDHAILGLEDRVAIVDPGGSEPVVVADGAGAPLVAGPDPDASGAATRIAWIDGDGLHTERVRLGSSRSVVETARSDLLRSTIDASRWQLLATATFGDLQDAGLSSAWMGALSDGGCRDLILPGAMLPCGAADLRAGAAWAATRPIAAMPIERRPGMLIAAGLGWTPNSGPPPSPSPWAAGPPGWWRRGPSTPFAISEVRAADVSYFQDFPSPTATLEETTDRDGKTILPGFTGTRLFVRVTPLADGEEGPDVAPNRFDALTTGPGPGGLVTVARVPVPPGNESGRDGSFTTLSLADVRRPDGEPASRWALQVVPINDWGEVGFPTIRTIVSDAVGPTLNLETPFTSPVWPFLARLPGRAEPGSTVSMEGKGEVFVDERGRFTVATHLAPWPQTIRLTATDASGNASTAEFTLVGGVDYRQFPWPLILAVALLLVVAARGLAAAGRARSGPVEATRWSTGTLDESSMPEIEELPPGSGLTPSDRRSG